MKVGAKEAGLLLLGTGVFIVAVVVAHWYFFNIIPRLESVSATHTWCNVEGGKAVVRVQAGETIEKVRVEVGGNVCEYPIMRGGTSNVCVADVNGTTVYKVKYLWRGKEYSESGICMAVGEVRPLAD